MPFSAFSVAKELWKKSLVPAVLGCYGSIHTPSPSTLVTKVFNGGHGRRGAVKLRPITYTPYFIVSSTKIMSARTKKVMTQYEK